MRGRACFSSPGPGLLLWAGTNHRQNLLSVAKGFLVPGIGSEGSSSLGAGSLHGAPEAGAGVLETQQVYVLLTREGEVQPGDTHCQLPVTLVHLMCLSCEALCRVVSQARLVLSPAQAAGCRRARRSLVSWPEIGAFSPGLQGTRDGCNFWPMASVPVHKKGMG